MSKTVLGASALALLIGVSGLSLDTASAQNGGEARSNDRTISKKLDDRDLTPVRPIRRVGEDSWPAANNQPAPARETSGQSATDEKKDKKENTAQNAPKPETKRSSSLGNQSPPPDKPQAQEKAKDTARQSVQPKQDTARQENKPDAKQDAARNKDEKKSFASIRLGTDENGRVAVNEAQERQIASEMRKHRVESVNVKVSVGSVAPANVRLAAVSSGLVDILPQFRGDSFFATSDDIVIVEPSSKKVIALIPVKLTATASRAPEDRTSRAEAPSSAAPRPAARTATRSRDVTVGQNDDRFPTREEILAAPVTRGPAGTTVTRTYRSYQYDPDDDDDVVVIERRRPRLFPWW
jgi:hypothetical protein